MAAIDQHGFLLFSLRQSLAWFLRRCVCQNFSTKLFDIMRIISLRRRIRDLEYVIADFVTRSHLDIWWMESNVYQHASTRRTFVDQMYHQKLPLRVSYRSIISCRVYPRQICWVNVARGSRLAARIRKLYNLSRRLCMTAVSCRSTVREGKLYGDST